MVPVLSKEVVDHVVELFQVGQVPCPCLSSTNVSHPRLATSFASRVTYLPSFSGSALCWGQSRVVLSPLFMGAVTESLHTTLWGGRIKSVGVWCSATLL